MRRTSSTTSGALTEGNAVVVTDVGQHQMWEAQYYKHESPRSLITSGGLGTMGFALPAAIGAKVARPDAEVWVVVGDGGFQMTMCELATMVQEELDVNIAIINNGYLGMVRQWQEFFYEQALRGDADHRPELRQAGRRLRHRGATVTHAQRGRGRGGGRAPARERAALIDFQVEQEDSVYPDGAGRRRSPQDDPAAVADRRNRGGLMDTVARTHRKTRRTRRPQTTMSSVCFVCLRDFGLRDRSCCIHLLSTSTTSPAS